MKKIVLVNFKVYNNGKGIQFGQLPPGEKARLEQTDIRAC